MSADAITYCLERVTDYRDFERLCSALLAGAGYSGIDPLGGTGDEGRDAIIRDDGSGRKIVFAYTVRSDWRVKLASDCRRVCEKGHAPHIFVFVCTETLSAADKDFAHLFVSEKYGWTLDLFDLERLRTQIAGTQQNLIAQHPSIFTPPFFPQRGGESVALSRDTLLIDHDPADHAMATWLARRLSLAGFRTWCQGTAPLAGEDADETVRKLLDSRAQLYLPVLSFASLSDSRFVERATLAAAKDGLTLPCSTKDEYDEGRAPSRLRTIEPAYFGVSWGSGLESVLSRLASLGIKPALDAERGRQIALRDYLPTRVTVAKPEPVFANVFPLQVPQSMFVIDLSRPLTDMEIETLRGRWAFASVSKHCLVSFEPCPVTIPAAPVKRTPEFLWRDVPQREGKKTIDLAKELARRSLEVACAQKGLKFCVHRKIYYFPENESGNWTQAIRHVDGRLTSVQLNGTRTKGWGDHASPFLYQLAPRFSPQTDRDDSWSVVLQIYIRVTTLEGMPFEGKEIGRRRKLVSKSWWNKEWLARLLGVVQALETSGGRVEIGSGRYAVRMLTQPLTWTCPVALDVLALTGLADIGEEIAEYRAREHDGIAGEDAMNESGPEVRA